MIRVLHFAGIINQHDFIDGVLSRLDPRRFEISALAALPSRRQSANDDGTAYSTKTLNVAPRLGNYRKLLLSLVGEIRRFRPHILQAHHYHEALVASLAVRMARAPHFVIGHHYSDHIYYLTRGLKQKALLRLEMFCNASASRIVVPTQGVASILTKDQGVPTSKVSVIPYGFDLRHFQPSSASIAFELRKELGLVDKFVVLTCCRLSKEKGLDYLLRAIPELIARNERLVLLMIGGGPEEQRLRDLSQSLGLGQSVRFLGWRDDAIDWMATADLVVQPSLCESYCQVLVEALALNKPVVMTPVGIAPEVIGENERGRLVPPRDTRALVSAIVEVMTSPDRGRGLAELGADYVRNNLTAELAANRYSCLYESLLEGSQIASRMDAGEGNGDGRANSPDSAGAEVGSSSQGRSYGQ